VSPGGIVVDHNDLDPPVRTLTLEAAQALLKIVRTVAACDDDAHSQVGSSAWDRRRRRKRPRDAGDEAHPGDVSSPAEAGGEHAGWHSLRDDVRQPGCRHDAAVMLEGDDPERRAAPGGEHA
jgi:hypothetical protein